MCIKLGMQAAKGEVQGRIDIVKGAYIFLSYSFCDCVSVSAFIFLCIN